MGARGGGIIIANEKDLKELITLDRFPRSAEYDLHWVQKNEMGPNVLWMTEALTQIMELKPGMRVLDIGCGTAMSSIFLVREFDVQVFATDPWIKATDNWKRIKEMGVEDKVFPIFSWAQNLPYADEFFDAVVSFDSYHYFGTDAHSLEFHILRLLKRGGQIGIVSPASPKEVPIPLPKHLGEEWYWLNSVNWWRRHWERYPDIELQIAEELTEGWDLWVRWHRFLEAYGSRNRPEEAPEYDVLVADGGEYLGFIRMLGRRRKLD